MTIELASKKNKSVISVEDSDAEGVDFFCLHDEWWTADGEPCERPSTDDETVADKVVCNLGCGGLMRTADVRDADVTLRNRRQSRADQREKEDEPISKEREERRRIARGENAHSGEIDQ